MLNTIGARSGPTRPCSRPLRARDRGYFGTILCSALAAADGQAVGPPSIPRRVYHRPLCFCVEERMLISAFITSISLTPTGFACRIDMNAIGEGDRSDANPA